MSCSFILKSLTHEYILFYYIHVQRLSPAGLGIVVVLRLPFL